MTYRQTANLLKRQIRAISFPVAERVLSANRVNYKLIENILLEYPGNWLLTKSGESLKVRALRGEEKALRLMNKLVNEKNNPNVASRTLIAFMLMTLADKGIPGILEGLLLGMKDSNVTVREYSSRGLSQLALCKDARTLPGLVRGLGDDKELIRRISKNSLHELLKRKVKVVPYLVKVFRRTSVAKQREIIYAFLKVLDYNENAEATNALVEINELRFKGKLKATKS